MSVDYDCQSGNYGAGDYVMHREECLDGCDNGSVAIAEGQWLMAFIVSVWVAFCLTLFMAGFLVGLMF